MKALFIANRDCSTTYTGAHQCTNRNYKSICYIMREPNVKIINLFDFDKKKLGGKINKWLLLLNKLYFPLNKDSVKVILDESCKVDLIFIDCSFYGHIASTLRKNGYKGKIITFFHNIEIDYHKQMSSRFDLSSFLKGYAIKKNEEEALRFSDDIILLNYRDKGLLNQYYASPKEPYIIPISISDAYDEKTTKEDILTNTPVTLLFIGSAFFANLEGVTHFVKNIFPKINASLKIIGKGMSVLKNEGSTFNNVEIYDYIEDLSTEIQNADYMLFPIYKGGGMKVKTCEALMYGKNIIGTKEAFMGYDIDIDRVGIECNNDDEFIKNIQKLNNAPCKRFNMHSRQAFLSKYEFNITLEIFKKIINTQA